MKTIAIIGTLDTKGDELSYLRDMIEKNGCRTLMIDCGTSAETKPFAADITNSQVAEAAGSSIEALVRETDVSNALNVISKGLKKTVTGLYEKGAIDGVIAIGGGQGTFIGMSVMEILPVGFPKVMVSTLARAVKEMFINAADTVVIDPLVDIAGINDMLMYSLANAANIICGLASGQGMIREDKRSDIVALSMYGVTTRCADMVRERLTDAGYEVWAFHSNGIGGMNMERLIGAGLIKAVCDLTTAEVGQTYMGGTCATIKSRMEAAALAALPQVVSVGGMDLVNFLEPETIPEKYRNDPSRRFHSHNPQTTIMRTEIKDYDEIGKIFAEKLNKAKGPVHLVLPLKGISQYDKEGGIWHDAEADSYLFDAIKKNLKARIPVTELDCHINDDAFAGAVSDLMLGMMNPALKQRPA